MNVAPALSSARNAIGLRALCALAAFAWTGAPAAADDKASLENALLVEQLVDVATTQHLLHTQACSAPTTVFNGSHRAVGTIRSCAYGNEANPLAQPFVASPWTNAAAAFAVNGLIRLAFHGLNPSYTSVLRVGVVLYPAVIFGTLSSTAHVQSAGQPAAALTITRRF